VRARDWTLLPVNARRLWRAHLDKQGAIAEATASSRWNRFPVGDAPRGILTTGLARNYLLENAGEVAFPFRHLHVGAYPPPVDAIRRLAENVDSLLVIEEGQPWVERMLRGIVPPATEIRGKLSGDLPRDGELTPDTVREALGLAARPRVRLEGLNLPPRPPQLCQGCPHRDALDALKAALGGFPDALVTSDIGCYTLGALPPYEAIQSCICMGASVGTAKGAADAGVRPVLGVIGDSTFLHSGVTGLMDAVAENTPMTLIILDNETVGMTGQQDTVLPHSHVETIVLGVGVDPAHVALLEAHPRKVPEMAARIRAEIAYEGLSVVITYRPCIQAARRARKKATSS
jgi:indolepyruvate ferredoxin oxidoreductase alpha subunit